MKPTLFSRGVLLVFCQLFCTLGYSQVIPVVNDSNISISQFMEVEPYAVRIAMCPADDHLYYITFFGDIYRIEEPIGQLPYDSLIATEADHGINFLQGLAFTDSLMVLSGNYKQSGVAGYGLVSRGQMQSGGNWSWSNLMTTLPYASSATLYDHAVSAVCITPGKDSIIVCSGSRTDHGEVQNGNGLFPGYREVPLTTAIFKLPINGNGIMLENDSAWLDASGYLFARGVRNSFDVAYDMNGNLFGVENSGDRDDSDELNWLQEGNHYGFPWVMGGNFTGQQFPNYDPATDLLINHNSLAWTNNYFTNDTTYPPMPAGLIVTPGIRNLGPDADMIRDPDNGTIVNVSDSAGLEIRTFTSHKSTLGLVFDKNADLDGVYNGSGFVLGYTRGCVDSSGFIPGYGLGPFLDQGEDLLHLQLAFDTLANNFNANVTRIANGFFDPVDAEMVVNTLYVMEFGNPGAPHTPVIWKLEFPLNTTNINSTPVTINSRMYPNPSAGELYIQGCLRNDKIIVYDLSGKIVLEKNVNTSQPTVQLFFPALPDGMYVTTIFRNNLSIFRDKLIILTN